MSRGPLHAAAILAGGRGARLRPAVAHCPKVLAPVGGRPFLAYLLDQLTAAGIGTVVLCTGYLGEQVHAAFGDAYGALQLSYSHEPEPAGTAGALRPLLARLDADPLLVLNGDSYCGAPLHDFVRWHLAHGRQDAGSLLATRVPDTARYGTLEVDAAGAVVAFAEKGGDAGPGWINAGIYLLSRHLLQTMPLGQTLSLECDVFPAWVGRGLRAFRVEAPFIDIGTPESYASAERFFPNRAAPQINPRPV